MIEQTVRLNNQNDTPLQIHIEPWGEFLLLAPSTTALVTFFSKHNGTIEVQHEHSILTVYGYSGATFLVKIDNKVVMDYT